MHNLYSTRGKTARLCGVSQKGLCPGALFLLFAILLLAAVPSCTNAGLESGQAAAGPHEISTTVLLYIGAIILFFVIVGVTLFSWAYALRRQVSLRTRQLEWEIAEHKRSERSLLESEAQYRLLSNHMTDTIRVMDMDLKTTYISPSVQKLRGFTPQEILEMPLDRQLTPASLSTASEAFAGALPRILSEPGYNPVTTIELECYRRDGTTIWLESKFSIIRDPYGKAVSILAEARSIDDRKKAEAALNAAEETYRNIFLNSQIGLFRTDARSGMLLDANDVVARFTGYKDRAELLARPFSIAERYADPQDREKMISLLQAHGEFQNFEARFRRNDGSIILVRFSGRLIQDKGWIEGVSEDITERKQLESTLLEQERTMATMISNLPGFIYRCANDRDWTMVYISDGCLHVTGYSPEDFIGNRNLAYNDIVHPAFQGPLWDNWQEVLKKHGVFEEEYPIITRTGETRWVWERGRGVFSDSDELLYLEGFITDISERRLAEQALQESEERYRLLATNSEDVIWTLDTEFRFTYISPSVQKLRGLSQQEAMQESITDTMTPDSVKRVFDIIESRRPELQAGSPVSVRLEIQQYRRDRSTVWVEIAVKTITDDRGGITGFVGISRDISDRKHLEEEQQRVAKLESVGLLAGGIAHDFNNILTSILGNISLARLESEPGSEIRNSLEQAEKASLQAKNLTQQLLTFSRGGAPVKKLASLAELLKDTAGFALRGSNVKCQLHIPSDLWHAEIDTGQVSQVIQNLVINAQQSMPSGGTIDITAENMSLSETQSLGRGLPLSEGNYIRVAVTDHGSGIDAQHLDRVFDPFFTTKRKGSGLGLATAFSIARNHGGHLSVESTVGSGSTFYLYLPSSTEKVMPEKYKKVPVKAAGKARILVMDDEPGIKEVAGRMLRHLGYKDVEFASDGAGAIKLYKSAMETGDPFSAVILDLTVPGGMGGIETLSHLLKMDRGAKAIVSSGYADKSVMAEYKEYGFSGMVAKPYTLEELGQALLDIREQ